MKCGSSNPLGTCGWNRREVRRRTISCGCEALGDLVSDPLGFTCRDQCNDAAAKTAAGHPSAKGSGGAGRFDREIHLRHCDLEVVAHGFVRCVEQGARVDDSARPQDLDGLQHARVLSDYMAY